MPPAPFKVGLDHEVVRLGMFRVVIRAPMPVAAVKEHGDSGVKERQVRYAERRLPIGSPPVHDPLVRVVGQSGIRDERACLGIPLA
jgi:hypothetical protein